MAARCQTIEEMFQRKTPDGLERVYIRDDFSKGGPLIQVFREVGVSKETADKNLQAVQKAMEFAIRGIMERNAAEQKALSRKG